LIEAAIATAAKVAAERVSVAVRAVSVILTAAIAVPADADANAISDNLVTAVGTPAHPSAAPPSGSDGSRHPRGDVIVNYPVVPVLYTVRTFHSLWLKP
jgi:hypothetical protein